jgi:hypothetical protein
MPRRTMEAGACAPSTPATCPRPRVPGTCLPMGELETGFASALEIIA